MTIAYIVSSFAWALLGLLTGYAIGRGARAAALQETPAMTDPDPPPADDDDPAARRWWQRRAGCPTHDQILGAVVVLLAIASVAVMSVSLSRQQDEIDRAQASIACQTEYNRQNITATAAAREAALIEREANRAILEQAFSGRLAPPSLRQWIGDVQRADDLRAANPYPDRPTCDR